MKGHHGASACTEAATWMLQAILGFCYGSRSQIRLLRSRLQRLKSSPCHAIKGIEITGPAASDRRKGTF